MELPACVKHGLFSPGDETIISVGNAWKQLIGGDENRTMLSIAPTSLGTLFVSSLPGLSAAEGFSVVATTGPFVMHVSQWGNLVRRAWYGILSVAGPANIHIVSVSKSGQ